MSKDPWEGRGRKVAGTARGLEVMRDVLRGSLGDSLRGMAEEDRLQAAWTVACGRQLAGRGAVVGYEGGIVRVAVADTVWLTQMTQMRGVLARQMADAAGVPVTMIQFERPGASGPEPQRQGSAVR